MSAAEIEQEFLETHFAVKMMSPLRRERFRRALTQLRKHSEKQWEVYVRCTLGNDRQIRLAEEWKISRPAVFKLKSKGLEYMAKQMGWEATFVA